MKFCQTLSWSFLLPYPDEINPVTPRVLFYRRRQMSNFPKPEVPLFKLWEIIDIG